MYCWIPWLLIQIAWLDANVENSQLDDKIGVQIEKKQLKQSVYERVKENIC